ncbi:MAG: hypothetical protein AAGE94_25885, partial [Acidobacteriota bacterium]
MLKQIFTLTALLAIALMFVPLPAAADTGVMASFSTDLIGADADTWMDRFTVRSTCDFDNCVFSCNVSRNICFSSGSNFATCMLLYEYCLDDCY